MTKKLTEAEQRLDVYQRSQQDLRLQEVSCQVELREIVEEFDKRAYYQEAASDLTLKPSKTAKALSGADATIWMFTFMQKYKLTLEVCQKRLARVNHLRQSVSEELEDLKTHSASRQYAKRKNALEKELLNILQLLEPVEQKLRQITERVDVMQKVLDSTSNLLRETLFSFSN